MVGFGFSVQKSHCRFSFGFC